MNIKQLCKYKQINTILKRDNVSYSFGDKITLNKNKKKYKYLRKIVCLKTLINNILEKQSICDLLLIVFLLFKISIIFKINIFFF